MKKNVKNEKKPISASVVQTGGAEVAQDATKVSYKVYGKDFSLQDKDFIDYYKTRMKIMAMRYMLVGRVNNDGVYKIRDEIKYDLIKMYKEINDSGEFFYKANCIYMKKYFYFDIKISLLDNNKAKASLYLSEFVDDFLDEEYITSHIADFVDNYDEHFRVKVRQAFNLFDVAIKNEDTKISNLAVLMQDEYDIGLVVGSLYDLASQIYVLRMLKLLEAQGGEQGQLIIRRYKELIIDKDEADIKEKYKNTKYKSLLDRAIDEIGGIEKLNVNKDDLKSIVLEINKSVRAIDGMQKRPAAVEILGKEAKKEIKVEEQKKVAGKKQSSVGPKTDSKNPVKKQEKKPAGPKKEEKKDKKEDKKETSTTNTKVTLGSLGKAVKAVYDTIGTAIDAAIEVGKEIGKDIKEKVSQAEKKTEKPKAAEKEGGNADLNEIDNAKELRDDMGDVAANKRRKQKLAEEREQQEHVIEQRERLVEDEKEYNSDSLELGGASDKEKTGNSMAVENTPAEKEKSTEKPNEISLEKDEKSLYLEDEFEKE